MKNPEDDLDGFTDYWLGVPAYDNTLGQSGWTSADEVLKAARVDEINEWAKLDEAGSFTEQEISEEPHSHGSASGLMGVQPELAPVKAGLIALGNKALTWGGNRPAEHGR